VEVYNISEDLAAPMDFRNVGILPQHHNTARRHKPEDVDLKHHRVENLKKLTLWFLFNILCCAYLFSDSLRLLFFWKTSLIRQFWKFSAAVTEVFVDLLCLSRRTPE
jgi:hypothetical protein